jgi:hypothetical protein
VDHDPVDMLADEFVVRDVMARLSCLLIGSPRLFNCLADVNPTHYSRPSITRISSSESPKW